MTLAELRAFVRASSDMAGDALVILACDAEGNRYAPAAHIERGLYLPDDARHGYHYDPQDNPEAPWEMAHAVVLWPV